MTALNSKLKEIRKNNHCCSRSIKHAELGHITWLFCRRRVKSEPRLTTQFQKYCSAHKTSCLMAFTQAKTARIERGRRPVKNEFIFSQRNCVELPNREFKKLLQRRRGQPVIERMFFYSTYESRRARLKTFTLFITVKAIMKLNLRHGDKFKIEVLNISRRGSRCPDNVEFGHFTLLFCRVQR